MIDVSESSLIARRLGADLEKMPEEKRMICLSKVIRKVEQWVNTTPTQKKEEEKGVAPGMPIQMQK